MERKDTDLPSAGDVHSGGPKPDHELVAAVDEALIGDVLADLPEAQPGRALRSPSDFSSLYIRHRSGLAAHARRFLRDQRDVDEVVQETFLRLFLAISEIETEIQAIAFARRTLTNLCIDRYRADRRRPTLITLDASAVYDVTGDDEGPDPVLQAEDAAIVREALARLSPLHRAALVKREIEEKALPQIAAELGIAEDSVKHLLFRARRALRRLLVGTSVEPGADLTGAESPMSPLLRGAMAIVVFLVAAVGVAAGLRSQPAGGGKSAPAVEGLRGGLTGLDPLAPHAPLGAAARGVHHHRAGGHQPAQTVATSPTSSSAVRNGRTGSAPPKTNPPARHAPTRFGASRGHFKLRGPLTVTGAPAVSQGGVSNYGGDSTLAASSFSAPTDQGLFELNQSVTTSSSGGSSVTVTPALVVGDDVEVPDLTGSSAAVGTDASGDVTIDVIAGVQPDSSGNVLSLTSVSAQLVLTPDLARVLTETVTLSTQQGSQQAPVSAGGGGASGGSAGDPGSSGGAGSAAPSGSGSSGSGGAGSAGTTGSDNGTQTGTASTCPADASGTATTTDASTAGCQPAGSAPAATAAPRHPTGAFKRGAW